MIYCSSSSIKPITFTYYIDMCELWGFIREINSGISHVSFFPPELLLHNYMYVVWWLRPMLCYGEYTHDCKLKQFREMILTTLAHKQHDVIWRLPVWNVKNRHYLASCTLQFGSNLTKISFQDRNFNYFCALL